MKTISPAPARLTSILAWGIACAVTVVAPAVFFLVSYQYMLGSLDKQAEISAHNINSLITANPVMWRFEEVRLMELLERRTRDNVPEARRILSSDGEILAETKVSLRQPVVTRRHEVYDAGSVIARIEISRSLDKLLLETLLFAMVIGLSVVLVVRAIPLRAVRLAQEALKESEEKYRSLYESMREGMALHRIVYDLEGNAVSSTVLDINPSCESIFGLDRDSVVGRCGFEFFHGAIAGHFDEIIQAEQSGETLIFEVEVPDKGLFFDVSVFFPDRGLFATLFEDITERKKSYDQIQQLAYYDNLTGLPNRTLFMDRFTQAIAGAGRNKSRIALLFIDLDGFKNVNDNLGHAQGDELLKMVSERLKGQIRCSDTVARLGGDEFMIIISNIGEESNAAHLSQQLLDRISPPYSINGQDVYTSASIGISMYPDDGGDVETLLKCADMAMYAAKEAGRSKFSFYSQEMNRKSSERMELETNLRLALERQEFFLVFQPIIDASGSNLIGAEALVRWRHPTLGTIMPNDFIPAAESSGLIVKLGEWVLNDACARMAAWQHAGFAPVRLSVNVSGRQFDQRNFSEVVREILSDTGVDARTIQLELTETSLMRNADATVEALNRLKELELGIVIDDFGTGYSSLAYLKNFPIDRIKIDRSFVRDITTREDDRSIVEAILAMANKLHLKVVAEGVETGEQKDLLLQLGCPEMQGYFFHRPLSEADFIEVMRSAAENRMLSHEASAKDLYTHSDASP